MKIESPYFDLWKMDIKTGKGKETSLKEIVESNCNFIYSVDQLVHGGSVIGQYNLWGDCTLRSIELDESKIKKRKNISFGLEPGDTLPIGTIIMGQEIGFLSEAQREDIASKVSNELLKHPNTMLQYSPGALIKSMQEGRVILCLDKTSAQLLAFGQIWHYGQNLEGQEVYEFGSWLSFASGGYGSEVLKIAPKLHQQVFPESQLVAIVEYYNTIAQRIIEQSGGAFLNFKQSEYLRSQDGMPAFMRIYEITKGSNI